MTIREATAEQLKAIKNRSFSEQISFFWEYYGIKTICLILAVALTISFIVSLATKKPYGFTGVFFGVQVQESSQQYLEAFAQAAQIDTEKYQLTVQSSGDIRMDQQITTEIYQSMEAFTAMVASRSVDCFAGNVELFLYYGYLGYAIDLRTVLSDDELAQLTPYLHYVDGELIEEQENSGDGLSSAYQQRTDSTKPELMGDPIPVALSLDAATDSFRQTYSFASDAIIGICASPENPENALAFFRYCLGLAL